VSLWAIVVPHGTIYKQPGRIPRKVRRSQAALGQNGETGTTGSSHRCLESRQLPTASSMNTPYIHGGLMWNLLELGNSWERLREPRTIIGATCCGD
jgi:hypothetical protein